MQYYFQGRVFSTFAHSQTWRIFAFPTSFKRPRRLFYVHYICLFRTYDAKKFPRHFLFKTMIEFHDPYTRNRLNIRMVDEDASARQSIQRNNMSPRLVFCIGDALAMFSYFHVSTHAQHVEHVCCLHTCTMRGTHSMWHTFAIFTHARKLVCFWSTHRFHRRVSCIRLSTAHSTRGTNFRQMHG